MDRFWEKVDKHGPFAKGGKCRGRCWLWTRRLTKDGYGTFTFEGSKWLSHRMSLLLSNVQLIDGLEVDHLCRNRACVRPSHLEQVTHRENTRRGEVGVASGRSNTSKTHCPKQHPYAGANLYIDRKTGARHCLACIYERNRAAATKRKLAA